LLGPGRRKGEYGVYTRSVVSACGSSAFRALFPPRGRLVGKEMYGEGLEKGGVRHFKAKVFFDELFVEQPVGNGGGRSTIKKGKKGG